MKRQAWFAMFGAAILLAGCTQGTQTPPPQDVETIVATTMQAYTASPAAGPATAGSTPMSGMPVTFENVSLTVPNDLASGATADKMTAVEINTVAPWELAPTHLRLTLTEYRIRDKFHEPRLFVYPAEAYAASNAGAAEQLDRLQKILAGAPVLEETLPLVPFLNASPVLAAQIKLIPFQSGRGVRALTQYAQYAAPVNNRELFYHFQGLTNDQRYYVIAILPIAASILPEDENPDAAIPEGGVPIPSPVGPTDVYYFSVTEALNSLSADAFSPTIDALDALIQSLTVTTP